MVETTDP